jgi:hypothetical protein
MFLQEAVAPYITLVADWVRSLPSLAVIVYAVHISASAACRFSMKIVRE